MTLGSVLLYLLKYTGVAFITLFAIGLLFLIWYVIRVAYFFIIEDKKAQMKQEEKENESGSI